MHEIAVMRGAIRGGGSRRPAAAPVASAAAHKRAEAAARAPARTGCTVTGRMLPAAPAGTCRSAALAAPSLADQAPYSQPVELDQGSTPLALY